MFGSDDPIKKIKSALGTYDEIRRMADLASPLAGLDKITQASIFGPSAGIPDHIRKIIEGHSPGKEQLDTIRKATSFAQSPIPKEVYDLIRGDGPYARYLDIVRNAISATAFAKDFAADIQSPYAASIKTMKQVLEAQGLSPIQDVISQAFGANNAYSQYLDVVRSAAALAASNPAQDALRHATNGLPNWLRPSDVLHTSLRSWKLTAEIGAGGIAQPSLVKDVMGALYSERLNVFAFDVAVKLTEGLDLDEQLQKEWILEQLRAYAQGLIQLLADTKDWIARQGIINVLVLVITVAGLYYARESYVESHLSRLDADEQTALARAAASPEPTAAQQEMNQQLNSIKEAIQHQNANRAADQNVRVVIKASPLRVASNSASPVIKIVYPDDRVRVREVKDGWALVEIFEYKSEAIVTGWINRRVLRISGKAA